MRLGYIVIALIYTFFLLGGITFITAIIGNKKLFKFFGISTGILFIILVTAGYSLLLTNASMYTVLFYLK